MDLLSFDNPVFATYAIAAAIALLKLSAQSWMTIHRLMAVGGGFASPEDARPGRFNPNPRPGQTDIDEYVERSRRLHRNDLENLLPFLITGFLFVLTDPALWVARVMLFGFVALRAAHFYVYLTARSHEARGTLFTPASGIVIGMTLWVLWTALT
jgi:glutathione S-transferase